MNYTKTTWANAPSTSSPINSTNLSNIENGVEALHLLTQPVIIANTEDEDYTASTAQNAYGRIIFNGSSLTVARNFIVNTTEREFYFENNEGYAVTVKTPAGTGKLVASGSTAFLVNDGTNVELFDDNNAKLDKEQTYNATQKSVAHDYGVVTSTKTISLADGSGQNYSLTNTSGTNLTLTASNFKIDSLGFIEIDNVGTGSDTISFDSTFGGEDAQDLSAVGIYTIAYVSTASKLILGTAVLH